MLKKKKNRTLIIGEMGIIGEIMQVEVEIQDKEEIKDTYAGIREEVLVMIRENRQVLIFPPVDL